MKKLAAFVFVFCLLALAVACGPTGPEIVIEGAWVRPDPLMENAAGYLVIRNEGSEPDALTGVTFSLFEHASVHETVMQGEVHGMVAVDRLEIGPGDTVELQPLSYHLMLLGMHEPLEYGEEVEFTLHFEVTGDVPVVAGVRRE